MLTAIALNDFRKMITRSIYGAQYRVGSTFYTVPISDLRILPNNIVRVQFTIAHGSPCTINMVRLLNADGAVWAEHAVNVVVETSQTNHLQWFDFNIVEEEVK